MRTLLIIPCIIFIFSCSKNQETIDCAEVQYGEPFVIKIDEEVCFEDGRSVTFELIEGQLCPCNVVCVSPGEELIMLEAKESDGSGELTTYGTQSIRVESSIFSDKMITELSVTYLDDNYQPCSNNIDPQQVEIVLQID